MSHLYFGNRAEAMARHLGDALAARLRDSARDPFECIRIVVPNPYLGKWLRLFLARHLGITLNVQFSLMETEIWQMLREVDPREEQEPEVLTGEMYQFLVLSVLLEHPGKELEGLRHYLRRAEEDSPARWRRAWDLAGRMSSLIRDYEYHRQEQLILPWVNHEPAYPDALPDPDRMLERAQGTLFYEIIREPGGRRKRLNEAAHRNFKTLPQYAGELRHEIAPSKLKTPGRTVYLFGVPQMSELHAQTLAWLSGRFDLQGYVLTPLADAIAEAGRDGLSVLLKERLGQFRDTTVACVQRWMRAGVESLWRLQTLIQPGGPLAWDVLAEPRTGKRTSSKGLPSGATRRISGPRPTSVLAALQQDILNPDAPARGRKERLPQDCSLQIVGCPGVQREVETVYQSILHNLQTDPDLQLTDIAVLVTDMETYRPALQAQFDRDDRLRYSLIDHSAAGVSLWGQALLGMLDLAQENFARSRVFDVVLNPCVLTRLKVDRADAQIWLHWAEELGVYHGWDAAEREERGAAASPLFAWRHALQRLRLGRCMDCPDDPFERTGRFGNLVPHEDINSADRRKLDPFCRSIEGMLPVLVHLRSIRQTGRWWADRIRLLAQMFLAIPEDRPEEARVRDQLLGSLEQLELWDDLHRDRPEDARMPLALVRQFVQSGLQGISASKGNPLTAGVTIAAMQPMRPVPFRVIYVLGMNESLFPGRNALPSLDLRSQTERKQGDVLPAEQNLYLFLEVLLSAQSKLYLLYNNRELQRDRELLPAVPLMQLRRYLQDSILPASATHEANVATETNDTGEFKIVNMPLHGHDLAYLMSDSNGRHDVLCQYDRFARALAVAEGVKRKVLDLSPEQDRDLRAWRMSKKTTIAKIVTSENEGKSPVTLTLKRLRDFLLNPAKAILNQRLQIEEEIEEEASDDEPFVSEYLVGMNVLHSAMREAIRQYRKGTLPQELDSWIGWVDPVHEDLRLRCKVPSGPFGDVDRLNLRDEFRNRLEGLKGAPGLRAFLEERPATSYCGPLLVGESAAPIGAKRQFSSLRLTVPGTSRAIGITGHLEHVWHRPGESFEVLIFSYAKPPKSDLLFKTLIEPLLFCLTLLAHPEGCALAGSVSKKNLRWNFHLLFPEGVQSWSFAPDQMGPEEALAYLTRLAQDFLDDTAFDLLPLEMLEGEFLDAVMGTADGSMDENEFQEALREEIETVRERPQGWDSPLLQLLDANVPADALAKYQRRIAPLQRGLTAVIGQEAETPSKGKRSKSGDEPAAAKAPRARKTGTRSK